MSALPFPRRIGRGTWLLHPKFLTHHLEDEPHVRRWLDRFLRPGSTFFDVGANYGFHSMYAAALVGSGGRVVCFEPAAGNLAILRYHARVNRRFSPVVIDAAVSDVHRTTRQFFLLDGGEHASNSLVDRTGNEFLRDVRVSTVSVSTVTLDGWCADTGVLPDLVKVDVEGAEYAVLRGAHHLMRRGVPMVVAVHPFWLPTGESVETLLALLESNGYRAVNRQGEKVKALEFDEYLVVR